MDDRNWMALLLVPVAGYSVSVYAVDYLTAEDAQKIIFEDATAFVKKSVVLSDEQKSAIKKLAGVRQREDEPPVWRVEKDGASAGWFIVDNVIGKHEFITYAVGLTLEGSVKGVEIMSYRETHGDEVRKEEWRDHFKGKTLGDKFKLDVDVPNISGATLSCRNVTDGVKRLLALQQVVLKNE